MSFEALTKANSSPLNIILKNSGSVSKRCQRMAILCFTMILFVVMALIASSLAEETTMSTYSKSGGSEAMAFASSSSSSMEMESMNMMYGDEAEEDFISGNGGDDLVMAKKSAPMMDSAMARSGTIGQSMVQTLDQAMDDLHEKQNQAGATAPMLVHTGNAQMECKDLTETADKIEKIVVDDHQGYVENRSTSKDSSSYPHYERRGRANRMDMTMRVASSDFHAVIQSIQQMEQNDNDRVKVLSLSTESRDVTDDYVDASSRADVIDATRKSLKELLSKADSISNVLKVQQELTRLTQQYESQTQRAKLLKKQSDWSTLYIGLVEELPPTPEPTHENLVAFLPMESAHRAWLTLSNGFATVGNAVVFFTVLILPVILLAGLVMYAMKGNKQSKKPAKDAGGGSVL